MPVLLLIAYLSIYCRLLTEYLNVKNEITLAGGSQIGIYHDDYCASITRSLCLPGESDKDTVLSHELELDPNPWTSHPCLLDIIVLSMLLSFPLNSPIILHFPRLWHHHTLHSFLPVGNAFHKHYVKRAQGPCVPRLRSIISDIPVRAFH